MLYLDILSTFFNLEINAILAVTFPDGQPSHTQIKEHLNPA